VTEPVYTAVVAADEIPEKSISSFEINGLEIIICRFRDDYYALENRCSHALSSFDGGRLRAWTLICPLHGGTFDIRDGSCTGFPAKRAIQSYPCRVQDGMVEVALDAASTVTA